MRAGRRSVVEGHHTASSAPCSGRTAVLLSSHRTLTKLSYRDRAADITDLGRREITCGGAGGVNVLEAAASEQLAQCPALLSLARSKSILELNDCSLGYLASARAFIEKVFLSQAR